MSIINQEMRRLNNIANTYNKTDGEVQQMWRKKWYELLESIVRRINESKIKRSSTSFRKIH